jgi:hypothetical protein
VGERRDDGGARNAVVCDTEAANAKVVAIRLVAEDRFELFIIKRCDLPQAINNGISINAESRSKTFLSNEE